MVTLEYKFFLLKHSLPNKLWRGFIKAVAIQSDEVGQWAIGSQKYTQKLEILEPRV
jgi:hypothetical protein